MKSLRLLWSVAFAAIAVSALSGLALADPCLVVYPNAPCTYHYDPAEYYTVGPGDPLYDPLWDRGGKVLLEIGSNEIDYSIYQAPDLMGFHRAPTGTTGTSSSAPSSISYSTASRTCRRRT